MRVDEESSRQAKPSRSPAAENPTTLTQAVAKREPDELVLRAQRGDTQAFTELFRRHRSTVAAIGYRMLGPSADLDDVVQEVFLQVHRSLPDFRGQAKFSTWLHRVAVNVVLMTRRRARSRPSYAQEDAGRHEPDDGLLPDQDLSRQRRVAAFQRLLDRLSDKKRTVFVLHEIEGIAPAEIAEMVDCPVLTVRTRLFYARKELAQLMRSEPSLAAIAQAEELQHGSSRGGSTAQATNQDDGEGEARRTTNAVRSTDGAKP
jgi:RNA polymerase sigma-70 factor (ECF subfamily)